MLGRLGSQDAAAAAAVAAATTAAAAACENNGDRYMETPLHTLRTIVVIRAVHHGPRTQYRSNRTEYRTDRTENRKNLETAEKSQGWLGF